MIDKLGIAREIIETEAKALHTFANNIPSEFNKLVEVCSSCNGNIILSGAGKNAFIAQKIAATMASFGIRAWFIHPADAEHGDFGKLGTSDVVLILSKSGETRECITFAEAIKSKGIYIAAITCNTKSRLSSLANTTLFIGNVIEAGSLALAPTTSTTIMLAVGDALAIAIADPTVDVLARNHPGGALGLRLSKVGNIMRTGDECVILRIGERLKEAIIAITNARAGAAIIVDKSNKICGLITDGDLRRYMRSNSIESASVDDCMTRQPLTVKPEMLIDEVIRIFKQHAIGDIPVVDGYGHPVGIISLKDIAKLMF
ncbi:MAG: KpsF/GutQ family sugar-phosphate isomerase [Nitrososphaerales archaeon]